MMGRQDRDQGRSFTLEEMIPTDDCCDGSMCWQRF
jgi:hypothetical protein